MMINSLTRLKWFGHVERRDAGYIKEEYYKKDSNALDMCVGGLLGTSISGK